MCKPSSLRPSRADVGCGAGIHIGGAMEDGTFPCKAGWRRGTVSWYSTRWRALRWTASGRAHGGHVPRCPAPSPWGPRPKSSSCTPYGQVKVIAGFGCKIRQRYVCAKGPYLLLLMHTVMKQMQGSSWYHKPCLCLVSPRISRQCRLYARGNNTKARAGSGAPIGACRWLGVRSMSPDTCCIVNVHHVLLTPYCTGAGVQPEEAGRQGGRGRSLIFSARPNTAAQKTAMT